MKRGSFLNRPMRGRLIATCTCRCCVTVQPENDRASEKRAVQREIRSQINDAQEGT